ncbi:MAG: hypothetical protein ACE37F_06335, partial [Nannocystaceae bacterium]
DLVFLHLSDAAQGKLKALMDIEQYDLQSDIAKKLVERGQVQGKIDAALLVLSGRGLSVPDGLAEALAGLSAEDLDEALRRSATVASADELLEG